MSQGGDFIEGRISSEPLDSFTVTADFGGQNVLVRNQPLKNTLGYDIFINILTFVTQAVDATITLGIGSTSPPQVNTVIPLFSSSASDAITFTAYIPNGYYVLVSNTGIIVSMPLYIQAMAV